MGFYTDWFLAGQDDAQAVATIATTGEHSFEDWPHLSLKGVGEIDLALLWGILRGEPDSIDSPTDDLLVQVDDEVFVTRIEPGFVAALAAVNEATIKRLAAEWRRTEGLEDWSAAEVERVLTDLVRFSQRASREGKPVLQLSVV